ncbi:hypothetical protein IE81DRAFT_321883 [Ceraceosorus guamensis]|uniref:Methyltransferase type 11 domain-containing protein n=1 Tax=Ceraceosorus guamensis TaxID=1522189 RepID=A0A316W278_9BASI|nr:hypothetical protein IE81DRAFT_321883 [Ceraceosorus guamensis]PWN43966.1 hypothetical protein IE81DRAFT_321883 [Ceraceosorus guamensis]
MTALRTSLWYSSRIVSSVSNCARPSFHQPGNKVIALSPSIEHREMSSVVDKVSSATSSAVEAVTSRLTPMHPLARSGFDLSGASGLYDRARPSYPTEAIEAILTAPTARTNGKKSKLSIVELGSGTGIATRALLAQSNDRIAKLVAVEPSTGMRQGWETAIAPVRQTLHDVELKTVDGAFENINAGHDNDIVLVAQAWHWTRDFSKAIAEISSTLRPGGVFALMWNLEDRDAASWVAGLRDHYEQYENDTPQYRRMLWREPTYAAPALKDFDHLQPLAFSRELPTTIEGVTDRLLSKSYISVLGEPERTKLIDSCRKVVESSPDRKWLDEEKGIFAYPYKTDLLLFRKK